MKQKPDSRN